MRLKSASASFLKPLQCSECYNPAQFPAARTRIAAAQSAGWARQKAAKSQATGNSNPVGGAPLSFPSTCFMVAIGQNQNANCKSNLPPLFHRKPPGIKKTGARKRVQPQWKRRSAYLSWVAFPSFASYDDNINSFAINGPTGMFSENRTRMHSSHRACEYMDHGLPPALRDTLCIRITTSKHRSAFSVRDLFQSAARDSVQTSALRSTSVNKSAPITATVTTISAPSAATNYTWGDTGNKHGLRKLCRLLTSEPDRVLTRHRFNGGLHEHDDTKRGQESRSDS